jgi:ubiquinone/menaquinone biosynthesis C-methylase UbiE
MIVKRVPLNEESIVGIETVACYDEYSGIYLTPEYRYFLWKLLHRDIQGGLVLDIGTGSGRLVVALAKSKDRKFKVIGLDISPDMLQRARENTRKARIENKVEFVLATADSLPFAHRSFDLVIRYASLHHWLDPMIVLNETQRVIKENGYIIIRDNRRVYGSPFWGSFIRIFTRFMNKYHQNL